MPTYLINHNKLQMVMLALLPLMSTGISHATPLSEASFTQSSSSDSYSFNKTAGQNENSFELPDLSAGGRFIEQNRHKALGEWSLRQLNANAPMLNDPWSQTVLESLTWQINAQARQQAPLALVVINNPSINAFAIPGGVIGINTGTVLAADSIDEVASVIAHEVAHLSQRHYEHRVDANKKALMLQVGGLLAAIAASMADGDAATAIMMGSQTATMDSQMAFSRSNEREADRIGMQLMAKSGYDPRAMPRFFSTMNKQSQLNMSNQAFLPSFVMTHPLSSERLSEAQSRANSYKLMGFNDAYRRDDFELLKWRSKVLMNKASEAELISASRSSIGAQIALAYWYGKQGRYQEAEKAFNKVEQHSTSFSINNKATNQSNVDLLTAITKAEVAGMGGKWEQAQALLQPYYHLYPERQDIRLYLTDAWLNLGKYKEALSALKPLLRSRPHDLAILSRMQRAYEIMATKNEESDKALANIATIHALRYRAQSELWKGRYNDALVSLNQAKTVSEKAIDDKSGNAASSSAYNLKPLIANIESEIVDVKTAKDFNP